MSDTTAEVDAGALTQGFDQTSEGQLASTQRPQRPTVDGKEAAEHIRKGEVLEFVRIENLKLDGDFPKRIELRNCLLLHPYLAGQFAQDVVFIKCTVVAARVVNSQFGNALTFRNCDVFDLLMNQVTIAGSLSLEKSKIHECTRIDRTTIRGNIRCWELKASGWLNLNHSRVEGKVDWRSLCTEEGISAHETVFAGPVLLRGSTVCKKLDFSNSTFEDALDLAKAKLHDFVYLEDIRQGPGFTFSVANALAERVMIRPRQIIGHLQSELAGDYETACREYGLLQRCYQSLQRYDDEDWALYRFKVADRKSRKRSWWRPWTKFSVWLEWLFFDLGCGYGTNPFRAIFSAMVIMVLFGLIYAANIGDFTLQRAMVGDEIGSLVNRLVFGLVTSVSVFTAGFTGDQLYHARGWMLVPLSIEALLGTLLWGFFIVAFSRKVIR